MVLFERREWRVGRRFAGCTGGHGGSPRHSETECGVAIAKGELRAISVAVGLDGASTVHVRMAKLGSQHEACELGHVNMGTGVDRTVCGILGGQAVAASNSKQRRPLNTMELKRGGLRH